MNKKIETLLSKLPQSPGVYKFKDEDSAILYVGKAKNLKRRVKSYFIQQKNRPIRTKKLVEKIEDIEWIEVASDWEAILLETNLIKELKPRYNVLMKDDKNFVYIKITKNEDFPRIKIVRKVYNDGARYFGPKTSAHQVKKTLVLLQKLFRFRSCDLGLVWDSKKDEVDVTKKTIAFPCLDYHIKRCDAPCISKITPQAYGESIALIEQFLEGKTEEIEKDLQSQIQACVTEKAFEKAVLLRDKLLSVQNLIKDQRVTSPDSSHSDVISFSIESGKAYFSLFVLRSGKIVNQENFVLKAPGYEQGDEPQAIDVLEAFLFQYYEKAVDVPARILVPVDIDDEDFFVDWLTQRSDRKVNLHFPKRGKKHELLDLAEKNAESFKKQHKARWAGMNHDDSEALEKLQKHLELSREPKRIECYDISHLSGEDTVASMVVFENAKPKKSDYRKFRLKTLEESKIDDFASMEEILFRRLTYLSNTIDGFQIKKASKSDLKQIAELYLQWRGVEEADLGGTSEYYVLKKDKLVHGFLRFAESSQKRFLLRSLYVLPEFRGHGHGRALFRHLVQRQKLSRVYVSAPSERKDFYVKLGFIPIKTIIKDFKPLIREGEYLAFDPKKNIDQSFSSKPDLIVIDGGKGQLSSAFKSMSKLGLKIPMIGLAKREEEIFQVGKSLPLLLPKSDEGLKLLQRLRNEAHRFAIQFQRSSRKKHLTQSVLDDVPGVGKLTKLKLLSAFGSVEGIKRAKMSELIKLVPEKTALKIIETLKMAE